MRGLKKRWRLMAFVAVGLLVAALFSLSPIAWATPGQQNGGKSTVAAKDAQVCDPLEAHDVVFTFVFATPPVPWPWAASPMAMGGDWTNVVFTDEIDLPLTVKNVTVECDPGPCPTYMPDPVPPVSPVTFTMATLPDHTTVIVTIECSCAEHTYFTNTGTVEFDAESATRYTIPAAWSGYVDPCEEFVPEVGSLLLLGSGLAGLAGYGRVRQRARRG